MNTALIFFILFWLVYYIIHIIIFGYGLYIESYFYQIEEDLILNV
jgi:hypothetical protein